MRFLVDENLSSPRLDSGLRGTTRSWPATSGCCRSRMRECLYSPLPKLYPYGLGIPRTSKTCMTWSWLPLAIIPEY